MSWRTFRDGTWPAVHCLALAPMLLAALWVLAPGFSQVRAQQLDVAPTNIVIDVGMWRNPPSEPLQITVTNATSPNWYWYLITNAWLTVVPSNGTSSGESDTATVHFVTANLDEGTYETEVYVVSPLCSNLSQRITVTVNVTNNGDVAQGVRVAPATYGDLKTLLVPIHLISTGNVNGVSFSLTYNKNQFSEPSAALGSGVPFGGGTLLTNTSQARTYGRIGIAVTLGAGVSFAAGTVEVATVGFKVNSKAAPTAYLFGFHDQPIARGMADTNAAYLNASWPTGSVMIVAGIEGDVAPRASNDWVVTAADVVQVGRFAAGLDTILSPGEFQKADIAPVGLMGDAAVSVIDWVQAGLYAAVLTPTNLSGGPYSPLSGTLPSASLRTAPAGRAASSCLRAVSFSATRGEPCTLKVELQSVGTENALGFSLGFDPALLQFVELRPIAIPVGAGFLVNSLQAGQGELGVLMALSPGSTLSATNRILLEVDFLATPGADPARTTISFTDAPVRREVASVTAKALPAVFEDAADVTLIPENWDPAPPVATLASTAPNPARVAPVPVSVTFSKNVMGFTAQGIVTGNARVENVSGSGRAYTFDLYPINRGRLTAAIPAGAATDYLGTPNLASTTFSCRFGAAAGDADGDGRADLLVYDPSSGLWYVRGANGAVVSWGQAWGGAGFTPVSGDYDGDGLVDLSVYQDATGLWYVRSLAGATLLWAEPWGGAGFTPVSGDYDGDLVSDLAVYDRASASWFIRSVAGQMLAWGVAWGGLGFEPVSGDYDGDLISDLAVFAPDGGLWYALDIGGQVLLWAEPWGAAGMVAVPGDYDGDGRADLAVYHEGSGAWYVKSSASGTVLAWADTWGGPGFAPVAGDFDGDGRADQAVYQRSAGAWYVKTLGGTVVFWAEGWGGQGLMPCSE